MRSRVRRPDHIEWPTIAVAAAIYSSFVLATLLHNYLHPIVLFLLGGYITAWHTSLQHEVIHGHPTRWPKFNTLLVSLPLIMWLPFGAYKETHLKHHRDENLTDPFEDPESFYVPCDVWERLPSWRRRLLEWRNSFLGRILIGPVYGIAAFWSEQAQRLIAGERKVWRIWLAHGAGLAALGVWLIWVCQMSVALYVACFAWPGTALTMARSFLEHQARPEIGHRTVIVEAEKPMALLYLNNNLHIVHHAKPSLAWYRLPAAYARQREHFLKVNGGYLFANGYREIVSQYLFKPKEPPVYPLS